MKIIIIITLVASSISCGNAGNKVLKENGTQTIAESSKVIIDSTKHKIAGVPYDEINISGIKLGDKVEILTKFGKEDSIIIETSDFESPELKKHYWNDSYFEVDAKGKIVGFFIRDKAYVLENFQIKVGDSKSKFEAIIKDLFSNSDNIVIRSQGNIILIRIGNSDDYIRFFFENDILKDFGTWSDL